MSLLDESLQSSKKRLSETVISLSSCSHCGEVIANLIVRIALDNLEKKKRCCEPERKCVGCDVFVFEVVAKLPSGSQWKKETWQAMTIMSQAPLMKKKTAFACFFLFG